MNGFLNIDKPAGFTSADVVRKLKPHLPKKTKIGHTGTLDPNVTGVLPIAIGNATKTIAFMGDELKVYHATMRFGIKTHTADIWGDTIKTADVKAFDIDEVNKAVDCFIGEIQQIPPMVSALKHNGKRLYELARQGKVIDRKARQVTVFSIENVNYQHPDLSFTVTCSRGTYIRTLCEDMAEALGSIATMTELIRLQTGPFKLSKSIKFNDVTESLLNRDLLPVDYVFSNCPKIKVDAIHARHLMNGVKVDLTRFTSCRADSAKLFTVYYNQQFIGVAAPNGNAIFMQKLLTSGIILD